MSRQTISSWENDKTYPDVQSLLILSEIFGTAIDDLVKGDVETMTESIKTAARTMNRLAAAMCAFLILYVAAMLWLAVQVIAWEWDLVQFLPTALLALTLWGIAMGAAVWTDRIKREHDLKTYREIESFMKGEPVDRETPAGKRARSASRTARILRVAMLVLAGAAAGGLVGYLMSMLVDMLFGA